MRIWFKLAAVASLALNAPAIACSVTEDYRVPTNYEMVADAELIMLGRVEGGSSEGDADPESWSINITPIAALKGELPEGPLEIPGLMLASGNYAVPSNPYDLVQAHPLAYIGGCIRYMFQRDRTVLFFLRQHEGRWVPTGDAFSRWAEDVPANDAPWLRAVGIYRDVAALPEDEREAALIAARDRLQAVENDPDAHLLAMDIERQLEGPNRPWNRIIGEQTRPMGLIEEEPDATALTEDEQRQLDETAVALDQMLDGERDATVDAVRAADEAMRDMEQAADDALRAMDEMIEAEKDE